MVIEIQYKLATEGRYYLRRHQYIGCSLVEMDDDGHFIYTGRMQLSNAQDAVNFLWKFMCTGVYVVFDSHELIKEIYDVIDHLCNFINDNSIKNTAGCSQHIKGVNHDSEISVHITNTEV